METICYHMIIYTRKYIIISKYLVILFLEIKRNYKSYSGGSSLVVISAAVTLKGHSSNHISFAQPVKNQFGLGDCDSLKDVDVYQAPQEWPNKETQPSCIMGNVGSWCPPLCKCKPGLLEYPFNAKTPTTKQAIKKHITLNLNVTPTAAVSLVTEENEQSADQDGPTAAGCVCSTLWDSD